MKGLFYFFILIILLSLQTTFLNFMYVVPNLILIFVIYIAIMEKSRVDAIITSAFAGLVLDFAQSGPTGLNAILFILIALVINILSNKISAHLGTISFLIISSEIVYNSLYFIFGKILFGSFNIRYVIANLVLKEMIITLICGVPLILMLRKIYDIFRKA